MDLLTAHGLAAARLTEAVGLLPEDLEVVADDPAVDIRVAAVVGLGVVSGWLPDANGWPDLKAAISHGASLLEAGVVGFDEVERATEEAIVEVLRWGERVALALMGAERN